MGNRGGNARLARAFKKIRPGATLVLTLALVGVFSGMAGAISGNIHPASIEVDKPSANIYPGTNCANLGADDQDWVLDCAANSDEASLVDSIATGIIAGVSGKTGGTGHWRGVRIVDGIAGGDQDIFLTGGKENDTSTWNVGAGTVGSSKYDSTQAYLANNQDNLYFGMERRGNNGTTAFDFEFNQKPPLGPYVPDRSVDDVLFAFEMSGSGTSGSAVPYFFQWDGSTWVQKSLSSLKSSINENTSEVAPPWGHVDSKGNWVGGNYDRFEFAEGSVALDEAFPNFDACGGAKAFVQVRTRSAVSDTSDLKDATKIFEFIFGAPEAAATLATNCLQQFTYSASGSKNTSGGTDGLSHKWEFSVTPETATLSEKISNVEQLTSLGDGKYEGTKFSGTVGVTLPSGVASATIQAKHTLNEGSCADDISKTITVYRTVGAQISVTPGCTPSFDYSATPSGGLAPYSFAFELQKETSGTFSTVRQFSASSSSTVTGTLDPVALGHGQGRYRLKVTITDSQGVPCAANATTNPFDIRSALTASAAKGTPNGTNLSIGMTSSTNALSGDSLSHQWQVRLNGTWTNITGATNSTMTYSSFETDATPEATSFTIGSGNASGSYVGRVWPVQLRVRVVRTLNSVQCTATSDPVTVKMVKAVDP